MDPIEPRRRGILSLGLSPYQISRAQEKGRTAGELADWIKETSPEEGQVFFGRLGYHVICKALATIGLIEPQKSLPPPSEECGETSGGIDWSLWQVGRSVDICRPKSNKLLRAVILGPGENLLVHYHKDHGNIPCIGARCRICPEPAREKVYLPVGHTYQQTASESFFPMPGILEVGENWMDVIQWRRGLVITAAKIKGRYQYAAAGMDLHAPAPFPVLPFLEIIFGMRGYLGARDQAEEKPDVIDFDEAKKRLA